MNYSSEEHKYFRWKVLSYLFEKSENDIDFRSHPFKIQEDGPTWVPPENYQQPELNEENHKKILKYFKRPKMGNLSLDMNSKREFYTLLREVDINVNLSSSDQLLIVMFSFF